MRLIVKRPSGYKVQIRKSGMHPINRTFDTLKEAQEFRDRMLIALKKSNAADILRADTITLEEAIDHYLESCVNKKRSANSERSAFKVIKEIFKHLGFLHLPLSEFDLRKAKSFVATRKKWHRKGVSEKKNASEKTIVNYINYLSKALDEIIYEENLTIENPMKKVIKPKVDNQRDERITDEDIKLIIDALPEVSSYVKNHTDHRKYFNDDDIKIMPFIIRLAVNTGLRRGDIIQLRLNDFRFDVEKPYINVRRSITKTKKPRSITLLKSILPECKAFVEKALETQKPNALLVKINKDNISAIFRYGRELAGFEDLRFHDLRHEATSRLVEAGVPVAIAMSFTGHKTLQMIGRYTHLTNKGQAKAIEKAGL